MLTLNDTNRVEQFVQYALSDYEENEEVLISLREGIIKLSSDAKGAD